MENGTGKSSWESIDELQEDIENMKKSLLDWSSPNLDPCELVHFFNNICSCDNSNTTALRESAFVVNICSC